MNSSDPMYECVDVDVFVGNQPLCQRMIGVYNHLRNARYLGSMKPFSGSVIGSIGLLSFVCLVGDFLRIRSHGIHHHFSPPFWGICFYFFLATTEEANPSFEME